MGTITININNGIEQQFREVVKKEKGIGKGQLGSAVQEALQQWIDQKQQQDIVSRQLAFMKQQFNLGKYKFKREELYDRSL